MSFLPKKIVNETVPLRKPFGEEVCSLHVNRGINDTTENGSLNDDDIDGYTFNNSINCFCGSTPEDEATLPLHSFDKNLFEFRKVSADQIAAQLTLIDIPLFKAITVEEFSNCAWSRKDKATVAPNVVAFTKRFNQVCFWVEKEILHERNLRLRAEIVTQFIKIAKKLLELNNIHSLMAIVSGLQSAPIHRLSQTWKVVAKKDKASLDKLAELLSPTENSKMLREHLNGLHLPCIPYLGMYLTDLTYLDMMKRNGGGSLPTTPNCKLLKQPFCTSLAQLESVLNTIGYFQNSTYDTLAEQPHIMEYLTSVQYIEELEKILEDSNFMQSLEIEPNQQSAAAKSFLLGHHHSFTEFHSHGPIQSQSLLRSKSDEDLLHASPLLSTHRASVDSRQGNCAMVNELNKRLTKIVSEEEAESFSNQSPFWENEDKLSTPVIKITKGSPIAEKKRYRASSEDLCGAAPTLTKSITPVIVKKFVPVHRKAKSLGNNVLATFGIQGSGKSKSAETPPPVATQQPTRSLLDDSVLPPSNNSFNFMPTPGSVASSSSSSLISLDTDEEELPARQCDTDNLHLSCDLVDTCVPIKEGLVKRRIIKNHGKTTALKRKQKMWVRLVGCMLLMWPHKRWSKKASNELPTAKEGLALSNCRVIYQDQKHPFKLADHQFVVISDKNTVVKFSVPAGTLEAALWVEKLRNAIWNECRRVEEIETNQSLIKL